MANEPRSGGSGRGKSSVVLPGTLVPSRRARWRMRRRARAESRATKVESGKPTPFVIELRAQCEQQVRVLHHGTLAATEPDLAALARDEQWVRASDVEARVHRNLLTDMRFRARAVEGVVEKARVNFTYIVNQHTVHENTYVSMLSRRLHERGQLWTPPEALVLPDPFDELDEQVDRTIAFIEHCLGGRP